MINGPGKWSLDALLAKEAKTQSVLKTSADRAPTIADPPLQQEWSGAMSPR